MNERLEAIQVLLQDPTSNLTAAAVGLAMIVLFVIIVVLLVLAWAMPSEAVASLRPRKKGARKGTRGAARRRRLNRTVVAAAALVLAVSMGWAYTITSSPKYCTGTCHAMALAGDQWKGSTHSKVRCVRCHEGRPIVSAPQGVIARVRSGVLQVRGRGTDASVVTPALCLQCHQRIIRGTIKRNGMVMSHREVVEAGMQCSDCHGDQGHTESRMTAGMQVCLRCHDGDRAPATCTTCHSKGADASIKLTQATFGSPVMLPDKPACDGCHAQAACDRCHGLRMPHPANFKEPEVHARLGAFRKKDDVCFRCHVSMDCAGCHQPFTAHGANWDKRHQEDAPRKQYCNQCHRTPNFCDSLDCH